MGTSPSNCSSSILCKSSANCAVGDVQCGGSDENSARVGDEPVKFLTDPNAAESISSAFCVPDSITCDNKEEFGIAGGVECFNAIEVGDDPASWCEVDQETDDSARAHRRAQAEEHNKRALELHHQIADAHKQNQADARKPRAFGQWASLAFFMGRKLPGAYCKIADSEIFLTVFEFMKLGNVGDLDPRVRTLALEFCDLHLALQTRDAVAMPDKFALLKSLQKVKIDALWATWLQAQNAIILVHRLSETTAYVSTWPVQPPAHEVLRAVPGFIQIPEQASIVAWGAVSGEPFATRVAELATNEIASAKDSFGVANPTLVIEYLVPALGGEPVDLTQDYECIAKKVRDESRLSEGKKQPWRRPPSWLALKSLLHFACIRTRRSQGHIAYKVFLSRLFGEALRRNARECFDDDSAGIEAARKLARRSYKLQAQINEDEGAIREMAEAVKFAMQPVEKRWCMLCEEHVLTEVIVSKLQLEQDTAHRLIRCKPVLEELSNKNVMATRQTHKLPNCVRRANLVLKKIVTDNLECLASLNSKEHDDVATAFFDVEMSVMLIWEKWDTSAKMPIVAAEILQLLQLLSTYLPMASKHYKNDVEGRSRMVLTMFTIALLLDRYGCQEYPLLREHAVGIDLSVLDHMFLSRAREKKLLHALELYVDARRASERDNHTGILHCDAHPHALSVRFAHQYLRTTLQNAQNTCDRGRQAKEEVVEKLKKQHDNFNSIAAGESCICSAASVYTATNGVRTPVSKGMQQSNLNKQYKASCVRCTNLGKANMLRTGFYELLLPSDQSIKAAVVFDLQIPATLACLREVMYIVTRFCANDVTNLFKKAQSTWESEERLKQWRNTRELLPLRDIAKVKLAYTKSGTVPEEQRISAHDSFVVENERDAILIDATTLETLWHSPTWSLSDLFKIETRDPQYKALQFAIESWQHSENDVIAEKGKAHESLSLHEFECFGCLRAGIRLQLPRLARALAQQALSFDRHGVIDVLSALLNQTGPRTVLGLRAQTASGAWRRQAHELLGNPGICDDLCEHASSLLHQQESNWTRYRSLLTIVMIGRCVLQHATSCVRASQLLIDCRRVACDWITQLRTVMSRSCETETQRLRMKLVDVAAIANLTYDSACKRVFESCDDVATFIWLRAVLNDNVLLGKIQLAKAEQFKVNLLRNALRVALELEEQIHAKVGSTDALSVFVSRHWGDASNGTCGKWAGHTGPSKRWYETTFSGAHGKSTLHVDILRGTFLVNGTPVGQLPKDIITHENYVRLFGDSLFEVQPAVGGGWRTIPNSGGTSFLFSLPSKLDQDPVIVERSIQADGTHKEAQLISHHHFRGDLPDAFVEEYSHWLVRGAVAKVFFRPRRYDDINFKHGCLAKGAAFALNLETRQVVDCASGRQLIDIKSETFAELYRNVFSRVAPAGQVHIFYDDTGSTVVLPQLSGLQFHLVGGLLRSHEFGSFVAANQQLGTLIGLRHGLLLQDPNGDRTLLIPHAAAKRVASKHEVTLEIDKLRRPPLFVYNVRSDLRELHGQKDRLAWIYLAKLHALTAGPLPDPFLGRTGTAQSLHILGSGRSRGNLNDAVGSETLWLDTTLKEIACCTPEREIVTKNNRPFAETVNLSSLPLAPICAHEGFAWIVSSMYKEAKQADRLAQNKERVEKTMNFDFLKNRTDQANRRAYLQSLELYSSDSRLSFEDEAEIMGPMRALLSLEPLRITFEKLLDPTSLHVVARSTRMGEAMRTPTDPREILLLSGLENLRGLRGTSWHQQSIQNWQQICNPPPPEAEPSFAKELKEALEGTKATSSDMSWFRDMWIDLYNAAKSCTGDGRSDRLISLSLCLSYFATQQPALVEHLVQLMLVAAHADRFATIEPPNHTDYVLPHTCDYDPRLIDALIDKCTEPFMGSEPPRPKAGQEHMEYHKQLQEFQQRKQKYDDTCHRSRAFVANATRNAFKNGKLVDEKVCEQHMISNPGALASAIKANLARWRQNKDLHRFLDKVCQELQEIQRAFGSKSVEELGTNIKLPEEFSIRPKMYRLPALQPELVPLAANDLELWKCGFYKKAGLIESVKQLSPYGATIPELPISSPKPKTQVYERLLAPLREGWELAGTAMKTLRTNTFDDKTLRAKLQSLSQAARIEAERILIQIQHAASPRDTASRALDACGLWPQMVPNVLLPTILGQLKYSESWRQAVGVYAFLLRHQQRARRCIKLLLSRDTVRLEQELKNVGCEGWTPQNYPEWLLLELDNDFCIRAEQATVAREMMSANHGNRLLQLLMGAGKTAIIIPMIIAALADGEHCVRVTVPGPLYATNAADWQRKVGGLLGKRVYSMICRRDLKIEDHAAEILSLLQKIRHDRHVIVTVPEHRLSLENKVLELGAAADVEKCATLQQVLKYFEKYGRDLLDESDEILHPKFQLIYTLGKPQDLDGGRLRWSLGAAVLLSVARHAPALRAEFGAHAIELQDGWTNARRKSVHVVSEPLIDECIQHFPAVRLLEAAKEGAYAKLCELIADDFASGVHPQLSILLKPAEVAPWRRAVLDKEAPETTWKSLSSTLQKTTLLLRGLLAHMVLFLSLHKRWRVEYGSQPHGSTRMAVPYRAKDVAAEKTEFGHPDVALLLTTLHYYHQGLSRDQLMQALKRLGRKGAAAAEAIYSSWVQRAPSLTVQSWTAVNLDDASLFDDLLLPVLRQHMQVIDFWLDHFVFPAEAKQFGKKILSTPWDLCRDDCSKITTGFAGTDDAHLLLPLSIRQLNLKELKQTNGALLHNLLRKENDDYEALPAGATGKQLLEHVGLNVQLDVLLDAGALVIELSNLQVAQLWLEMRHDRKAAVYFEGDMIKVVDRCGISMPLAVSPFERSMQDCLLYLDDEHTRGSDFRLPLGRRAIVTLGKGMQKDKLAQTVMRMRQLGHGQSVCFIASFEADLQIASWRACSHDVTPSNVCKGAPCDLQHLPAVLSWCLSNTVSSTCDNLMYLASQGAAQIRKRHLALRHAENPRKMSYECAETELLTLQELYGHSSGLELMSEIVRKQIMGSAERLEGTMDDTLVKLSSMVVHHISSLTADVYRSAGLHDEEHERELEQEFEEERECVDRPVIATPVVPTVSDGLVKFALSGTDPIPPFSTINHALKDTSFAKLNDGAWDDAVRITPDFMSTVDGRMYKDSFLRSVTWMLATNDGRVVLISNFEAEHLATHFANPNAKVKLQLVTPVIRIYQLATFPSLPLQFEPPVPVHVFAGSVHGSEEFLRNVRSFLGVCVRQPSSPLWRELFEQKGAIASDGFVLPEFRDEVAEKLNIKLETTFSKSPLALLQRLYDARHISEGLISSPLGQLVLGASSSSHEKKKAVAKQASAPNHVAKPQKQPFVFPKSNWREMAKECFSKENTKLPPGGNPFFKVLPCNSGLSGL